MSGRGGRGNSREEQWQEKTVRRARGRKGVEERMGAVEVRARGEVEGNGTRREESRGSGGEGRKRKEIGGAGDMGSGYG